MEAVIEVFSVEAPANLKTTPQIIKDLQEEGWILIKMETSAGGKIQYTFARAVAEASRKEPVRQ